MPRPTTPTIRRWQLGQQLRQLRDTAGVQPLAAAKEIGVSTSTLSRIENGKQTIKVPYVKLLVLLYEADRATLDELMTMAEEASRPEWFASLARSSPDWFKLFLGYESVASTIKVYEGELVPGLLQTADYTRAVIPAGRQHTTEQELEQAAALRAGRQERAGQGGVDLHAVLNEAVLRRQVGGPDVMREQLRHIAELAALPNVTVQVLPFATGQHASMTSAFTLLGFEDYPAMNTTYIESGRGALYLEGKTDLDQYGWRFDQLTREGTALSPDDSAAMLVNVASDL
jgi:transcriptional regulator with XRE-family HTH domain